MMRHHKFFAVWLTLVLFLNLLAVAAPTSEAERNAESNAFEYTLTEDRLIVSFHGQPVATYVMRHPQVLRSFYIDLHAPTGERISRSFPPAADEPIDHEWLHPGMWLAFGDLNGEDFWRNRGHVEHVEFVDRPHSENGRFLFVVRNQYRSGKNTFCEEVCRHTISKEKCGYLLTCDSTFISPHKPITFGDQEEMGFGVRVTAPLRVVGGTGRIRNSNGQINEAQTWGKVAQWCDISGRVDAHFIGVTLISHPDNFRPSWFHSRDYGLCVANPFGRKAFTKGEMSRVVVQPGEPFRLRFGVLLHGSANRDSYDPNFAYRTYVDQASHTSDQQPPK